jgi:hypothetical protein
VNATAVLLTQRLHCVIRQNTQTPPLIFFLSPPFPFFPFFSFLFCFSLRKRENKKGGVIRASRSNESTRERGIYNETKHITKEINKKNEVTVCATAIQNGGNKFLIGDLTRTGNKQIGKDSTEQKKKESRAKKQSDRMKLKLKKLGKEM